MGHSPRFHFLQMSVLADGHGCILSQMCCGSTILWQMWLHHGIHPNVCLTAVPADIGVDGSSLTEAIIVSRPGLTPDLP